MEINLPNEHGRRQIFTIHTARMKANKKLDADVDIAVRNRKTIAFLRDQMHSSRCIASIATENYYFTSAGAGCIDKELFWC